MVLTSTVWEPLGNTQKLDKSGFEFTQVHPVTQENKNPKTKQIYVHTLQTNMIKAHWLSFREVAPKPPALEKNQKHTEL